MSCSAAGWCTADGYDTNSSDVDSTLVEAESGTTWKIEITPNPTGAGGSELTSASCTAAGGCTAVGFYSDRRVKQ